MIATTRSQSGISRSALLGIALGVLILGFLLKPLVFPNYRPCEPCTSTGAVACGAPGCEHGRVACTAPCLKKEQPGWATRNVPGVPPDLLLMELVNGDGSRNYISQNHLGEVVEYADGRWNLRGACPTCNKTSRMTCPACPSKKPCPECGGKGKLRRWF